MTTNHIDVTRLDELLKGFPSVDLNQLENLKISGISLDSRKIKKGFLFCALKGEKVDGNDFIEEAFKRGAVFCLTDNKNSTHLINTFYIHDLRKHLGVISSKFYDHPSNKLKAFAVTGTNGKTSCVSFISQIAKLLNSQCGHISTIDISINGKDLESSSLTTPESIELQKYFSEMVRVESSLVAFEASSHGLEQYRLTGTSIDTAILTSFSCDHLDFHKTINNYKKAKKRLFTELKPKNIILNIDNILGEEIYKELIKEKESCKFFSVSEEKDADFQYSFSRNKKGKIEVKLKTLEKEVLFKLNTVSRPLASNVICALAAFLSSGFNLDGVYQNLEKLTFPKGRMDLIKLDEKNKCYIDYAHTPEALETSLIELREAYKESKIWCVFGCGGERDKEKRPKMGELAELLSDFLVITNDNPRMENELQIIEEITGGMKEKKRCKIIPDRRKAILHCINEMKTHKSKNILLIAGKGHEEYQDILGKKIQLSDHNLVKDFILSAK